MLTHRLHLPIRAARRGFTLLEIMLVVAIIAVAVSMVLSTVNRRKEQLTLEEATRELRGRILLARALTRIAGPSLETDRLVLGAGCPEPATLPPPAPQLWIRIDPQNNVYDIPVAVDYNAGTDTMNVTCGRFTLPTDLGAFTAPTLETFFGFTNTGRVVDGNGNPFSPFVQVRHTLQQQVSYTFRVLPSGVLCSASDPARNDCDKDPT